MHIKQGVHRKLLKKEKIEKKKKKEKKKRSKRGIFWKFVKEWV